MAGNLFYRILWDSCCLLFMERSKRVHFCIHPGLLAVCVSSIESMKRQIGQAPGRLIEPLVELPKSSRLPSDTYRQHILWNGAVFLNRLAWQHINNVVTQNASNIGTYVCPFLPFCFVSFWLLVLDNSAGSVWIFHRYAMGISPSYWCSTYSIVFWSFYRLIWWLCVLSSIFPCSLS